jgi:AcrR family transcriptional regulator
MDAGERPDARCEVSAAATVVGARERRRAADSEWDGERGARRERIVRAMASVVAERGYAGASVDLVVSRAGVSRKTFYTEFASREDCFEALLELGRVRTVELIGAAFALERSWRGGVRRALGWLLAYLDSEPELARVWLVESTAAGTWALELRERNVAALRRLTLGSWPHARERGAPLAAEGVMGAVLAVLQSHVMRGGRRPLLELLGPLMGLVTRPYLEPAEVEREIERGGALARAIAGGAQALPWTQNGTPQVDALANPSAHRLRQCLRYVRLHPGASNAEVGAALGVAHKGRVSTLLNGLAARGLLEKRAGGAGHRTRWRVTAEGERVARKLEQRFTAKETEKVLTVNA